MSRFTLESNREYWEDPTTRSIIDSNLHELEIQFIKKHLKATDEIADIGCGEGYATSKFAPVVARCCAIERSDFLRGKAKENCQGLKNVEIVPGDILNLAEFANRFDAVVTQRCLINLPGWEMQAKAIDNIHATLKPGGRYIMIENTHDANNIMNDYRAKVGLGPIPIHWHNEFLDMDVFTAHLKGKFKIVERNGFNLYYLLTRVYTQIFASFTGAGKDAIADPIFEKSDRAARILFEQIGDRIEFKDNEVFGPIQGFVLEKI